MVEMYHHVAAYLTEIKVVPPYFSQTHRFKADDMKDEHI